jgi:hypothetical protein
LRLEPNWKFNFARDDPARAVIDFLHALFHMRAGEFATSEIGDQFTAGQFAAEAGRDIIAVTDHADFVKIAHALAARAFDNEIVEKPIDGVGDAVAFAFVVAPGNRLDHRAGLVDQKNETTRVDPADFGRIRHRYVS